jgi:hypothetical protein
MREYKSANLQRLPHRAFWKSRQMGGGCAGELM